MNTLVNAIGKGLIKIVKKTPPILFGVAEFGAELVSDSYYVVRGNKKKQKLIKRLNKQNIKFSIKKMKFKKDYQFADACVLSGLTASQMLSDGVPADVQEAFEKAYPNLASENSFIDTWSGYDDYESRLGFVNGIKGKLFEIKYADYLNQNLETGYTASLSSNPINEGWDIKIVGPNDETANLLQLKATTTISHIKNAINNYPEIDVVTLEDLQGQLSSISSIANVSASQISNDELMLEIGEATGNQIFFFPTIPLLAVGYLIFDSYKESDLSEFKKHQKFSKRASGLALDTSIISASASPFIGIPLVLGKAFLFKGARKNKEIIGYLKAQIKKNKKAQKIWERQVSRRDFLKGLTIGLVGLSRIKK
tara:strand:- start:101 stop:1201 length:1101 start_codon:yes stop_codon:yes gene_type:complete